MTRCLIVYVSVGGTTERIADRIALGLESTGCKVDKYNLKKDLEPSIENYDLLGIGTPAHYFRPSIRITDFLKSLPNLSIPYFTFISYGSIIGDAGNRLRKRLTKKGGRDAGYFKCNGWENFIGYLKRGVITYPSHPDAEDLAQAENFGKKIPSNLLDVDYEPEAFDPKPNFIYRFERFSFQKWIVQKFYYRFFKVNESKCIKCGICVDSCPTHNIDMKKGELPEFGKQCIACFYCELKCPEDAITSAVDWKIFSPFMNHNVRKLSDIPSVEIAQVELRRGEVIRLEQHEKER